MEKPAILRVAIAAALLCAAATPSLAEMSTSMSGFGTLGGVITDSDDAEYVIGNQRDGADDEGSLETDSRLGVQYNTIINDRYSGTLQVFGRYGEQGNFEPNVEWAFLRAQLNDTYSVRLGRIGAPYFSVSDFREVGYANTVLRPPQDVYSQVPFRSFDGVDVTGNFEAGDALINAQLLAGRSTVDFPGNVKASGDNMLGVNVSVEYDIARFRIGYTRLDLTFDSPQLDQLVAGLRQTAQSPDLPPAVAQALLPLSDEFDVDDDAANFTGVGLDLDLDPIVLSAEYTRRRSDSYQADTTGWYVMAAYRLGSVTPYAYVSELKQDSATSTQSIPPVPALAPLAAGANALLRSIGQQSTAAGLRWDFKPGFAMKAQVEHIEQDAIGNNFRATDPQYAGGDSINVYSLGVDFIF